MKHDKYDIKQILILGDKVKINGCCIHNGCVGYKVLGFQTDIAINLPRLSGHRLGSFYNPRFKSSTWHIPEANMEIVK